MINLLLFFQILSISKCAFATNYRSTSVILKFISVDTVSSTHTTDTSKMDSLFKAEHHWLHQFQSYHNTSCSMESNTANSTAIPRSASHNLPGDFMDDLMHHRRDGHMSSMPDSWSHDLFHGSGSYHSTVHYQGVSDMNSSKFFPSSNQLNSHDSDCSTRLFFPSVCGHSSSLKSSSIFSNSFTPSPWSSNSLQYSQQSVHGSPYSLSSMLLPYGHNYTSSAGKSFLFVIGNIAWLKHYKEHDIS